MEYLVDTVAILRFISNSKNIGKAAFEVLKEADLGEQKIFVSSATLIEIMTLTDKKRLNYDYNTLKDRIISHRNYTVVDLDEIIISVAKTVTGLELFDRLLVATAKHLKVPLLTCDQEIIDSGLIEVVW